MTLIESIAKGLVKSPLSSWLLSHNQSPFSNMVHYRLGAPDEVLDMSSARVSFAQIFPNVFLDRCTCLQTAMVSFYDSSFYTLTKFEEFMLRPIPKGSIRSCICESDLLTAPHSLSFVEKSQISNSVVPDSNISDEPHRFRPFGDDDVKVFRDQFEEGDSESYQTVTPQKIVGLAEINENTVCLRWTFKLTFKLYPFSTSQNYRLY